MNGAPRWYALNGVSKVFTVAHIRTCDCHPSRIIDNWAYVVVTQGCRTFRLYDEDIQINKGEFFILPPNIPHYGLHKDDHEAFYIHFLSDGCEMTSPQRINAGQIWLPQYGAIPNDIDCINMLDYAARNCMSPFSNEHFLISQVQAILYQTSYFHQRNNLWHGKNTNLTDRILHYIQDNFYRPLNSNDYEEMFKKTYRQLNDLFVKQYGITIKQMQMKIRIDHAKLMLSTGYSISETSEKCGFEDYLYFLKAFHKSVGMTPKVYRSSSSLW